MNERFISQDVIRWGNENPYNEEQINFVDKEIEPKLIDILNNFRYIDERVYGKEIHVEQIKGSFEMGKGKRQEWVVIGISQDLNSVKPELLCVDVSERDIGIIQKTLGEEYRFTGMDCYFSSGKLKMSISFEAKSIQTFNESEEDYKKRVNEEVKIVEEATYKADDTCLIVT